MDEARTVLARLDRIERLDGEAAPAAVMLEEVRALLREAEAWVRAEAGAQPAAEVLERCRETLAEQPEIGQAASRTLVA